MPARVGNAQASATLEMPGPAGHFCVSLRRAMPHTASSATDVAHPLTAECLMPFLKTRATAALAAWFFVLGTSLAALAQNTAQSLPTIELNAGIHKIKAMLAEAPPERSIGLMFRQSMASHEGMLFVFEEPAMQCFWMKNTLLPLSAAFVDDSGTVINIEDMQPQTLDSHCSRKPVRYVLEMNQGWFAKRGIKPGSKLSGSPFQK